MNAKIQQLMDRSFTDHQGERFDPERFAELIVAECIDIVDNAERGGSNEIWDNAVKFIRRDLQEHFGVEE
jgi:NTP pyrophosphatase (non-canonical NTP hydrolase)